MTRSLALASLLVASLMQIGTGGAALAQTPGDPLTDLLLTELRAAPDASTASALELRLHEVWQHAGSPAARLLLEHGLLDLQHNAAGEATEDFDSALALQPDYIEALNDRAAARLLAGDTAGALRDLAQVLSREPRHFAALQLLSHVAESRQDWKAALEAWQKALALDPKTPDGQERLHMLLDKAEGEPT
jgi:tetratricopeptide (TPR) repeat protein